MIQEKAQQFTDAVDMTFAIPSGIGTFMEASILFSSAPTTSETLTITAESPHGDDYDTVLYSVDPSDDSLTNIYETFSKLLKRKDTIRVQYPNTDDRTISIILKGLDSTSF